MMTQTRAEVRLIKAQWETLPNRELAKVGDMNATLIGAPPFDDEDQSYGEEVAKVLETMGVEGIESPYFDTEIDHPDFNRTFPDMTSGARNLSKPSGIGKLIPGARLPSRCVVWAHQWIGIMTASPWMKTFPGR